MAWTAPRDWTGITNDIVTAAMLNVDVRDNLGVLSTHTHTGSAGQGGTSMSGLTLAALTTLTFADQSANPDAAGELQRNGNDLLFYGASVVNLTAADASAGTASLRTLGTTSVKAAAGNHTHNLGAEVDQATTATEALGSGYSSNDPNHSADQDLAASTESGNILTRTFTTTDDDVVWAVACGFMYGEDGNLVARLYLDGALIASETIGSTTWTVITLAGQAEKSAGGIQADLRVYNANGAATRFYWYTSLHLVMGSVNGKFI